MAAQSTPEKIKQKGTPAPKTPAIKRRRAKGEHDARMNFRINSEQKERIELAAYKSGRTISEFAAAALLKEAEVVLEKEHVTQLNEQQWGKFVEALENPSPLSESALAVARHQAKYTRRDGNTVELLPGYVENFPDRVDEGPF